MLFLLAVYAAKGLYSNALDKYFSSRFHDSCIWPLEVPNGTDAPHTHVTCCLSNINESGESKHQPRLHNETVVGRCFHLCHIYRQTVENGSVTSIYTRAPFPRRNKYPQMTNVCQCYSRRMRINLSTNISYKSGTSRF